jgi:hypothetical protein
MVPQELNASTRHLIEAPAGCAGFFSVGTMNTEVAKAYYTHE